MKKVVLLGFLWILSLTKSFAQQDKSSYLAGNGITYRVGQTIRLYRGSRQNGTFRSIYWGFVALGDGDADAKVGQYGLIIKKIVKGDNFGSLRVLFSAQQNIDGFSHDYLIDIEKAIDLCEIWPCRFDQVPYQPMPVQTVPPMPPPEEPIPAQPKTTGVADELTRAKSLLNNGVLTQKEFNFYKNQILTNGVPSPSPCEEIQKLADLHKNGTLSDREFKRQKRALLYGED